MGRVSKPAPGLDTACSLPFDMLRTSLDQRLNLQIDPLFKSKSKNFMTNDLTLHLSKTWMITNSAGMIRPGGAPIFIYTGRTGLIGKI
jgi:hypothetical protein